MSIIIGLTGPTGAGKSSCSVVAKKLGFKVVDCDKTARIATEKGSDGLKALTEVFGEEILNEDKALNRKKLASIAFKTPENTDALNKTILPFILELIKNETYDGNVLLDAPTLFESGANELCNKTIAVLADSENRLRRIINRDGLTLKEAQARMSAGKSDDYYKHNADYIIYNNGDENSFYNEFSNILKNISGGNEK